MEPGSFSDIAGVVIDPDLVRCLGFWWFDVQLKLAMWEKRKEEQEKKENFDQESTRQGVIMIVIAPSDDPAWGISCRCEEEKTEKFLL